MQTSAESVVYGRERKKERDETKRRSHDERNNKGERKERGGENERQRLVAVMVVVGQKSKNPSPIDPDTHPLSLFSLLHTLTALPALSLFPLTVV